MTYRELLKLYREGTLSEEIKNEVEADIEKQDAISEYLCEQQEIPGFAERNGENDFEKAYAGDGEETAKTGDAGQNFAALVQKTIRRAFLKMGVAVGAVVLVILLCAVFVLPRAVSLFYYDPTEIVGTDEETGITTDRMSLDMAVYSEMFLPGYYRSQVSAEAEGYGVYTISIPQTFSWNGKFTTVNGKLVRGKLTLYDTDVLSLPTGNAFVLPEDVQGGWNITAYEEEETEIAGAAGTREEAYAALGELDDHEFYLAFISLKEITDYDTFQKWFGTYEEYGYAYGALWYAVYAEDEDGYILYNNVGFSPRMSGGSLEWDREKYPYLSLFDTRDPSEEKTDGDTMKTHMASLLSYWQDHPQLWRMMNGSVDWLNGNASENAGQGIAYIEENGLQLYGFAVSTQKNMLQALAEDDAVSYIYTTPQK